MKGTADPPFVSVALVDTDKPKNDRRASGQDNLAAAREVSGLGEDVCFLNAFNADQGLDPLAGMDSAERSSKFDTSGLVPTPPPPVSPSLPSPSPRQSRRITCSVHLPRVRSYTGPDPRLSI